MNSASDREFIAMFLSQCFDKIIYFSLNNKKLGCIFFDEFFLLISIHQVVLGKNNETLANVGVL